MTNLLEMNSRDFDVDFQYYDCESLKIKIVLFYSGIDSRYNDGMLELINYLLFGFYEVRKAELEG